MKIRSWRSWRQNVPLARPYTIAYQTVSEVELLFVEIVGERGLAGYGSASPAANVTGESPDACAAALERLAFLEGRDALAIGARVAEAEAALAATPAASPAATPAATPAAAAAVDMALWDLFGRAVGRPLVDLWGSRPAAPIPTSVTIGIGGLDETLEQAAEHLGAGFHCLKVKIGRESEADLERLYRLRERFGYGFGLRVDANQGYSPAELAALGGRLAELRVELVEQPLPRGRAGELAGLPEGLRRRLAADEDLHGEEDAAALVRLGSYGIWNLKLMKCGGPTPAGRLAALAGADRRELMWGCNDESVVSIAAALHAAWAAPATRYLDLDGSFDLAADPFVGGFRLADGCLLPLDEPGLGVRPR